MKLFGMTRIEILLIALVVGVLGLLAVLAISSARSSARDAVRLSDVRQTQTGLELYFNDTSTYPETTEYVALGAPSTFCLGEDGFQGACAGSEAVYIDVIGMPPAAGLKEQSACSGLSNAYCYASNGAEYVISFELERSNALLGLTRGHNCATPSGFEPGACQITLESAQ